MATRLFLSDLHLHDSRPQITTLFLTFLQTDTCRSASELYILGDLFEFWAGDDAGHYPEILEALAGISARKTRVYFMPGNRDFLIGHDFLQRSRCHLLPDPAVLSINGQRVLLMHGDTLCTDDIEYQQFRAKVRSDEWITRSLSMPLAERMAYFQSLRDTSRNSNMDKPEQIMDVNQRSVEDAMAQHDSQLLIHGHTHRKAVHQLTVNGRPATRIVLGDWYQSGNVLLLNSATDYEFLDLVI